MDLTRSSIKLFAAKGSSALVVFAGTTFFARRLGPAELGTFFLFQTLLYLLTIPADLGVRGGVEKRLSEGMDAGTILASAVWFKLALLAAVCAGIFLLQGAINSYVGADVAFLLAVGIVVWEFSDLYIYTVRGELRVGETALLEFARQIGWIGLGAALVVFGLGVYGVIYGLIAGAFTTLLLGIYRSDTPIETPTRESFESLFDYSKYHFVSSIGGKIYEWMDVAIIGFFLTNASVGVYEIAWEVTLLVLVASYAIATTIFPQISQWSAEAATDRIESIVSRSLAIALALSIPALVGAFVFSREILLFVFGQEYTAAAGVLVILMIEKVFQSANDVFWKSLHAIDQPRLAARATVVTIALNLLLNVVLVPVYGITGAAIATATAAIANTVFHGVYLARFVTVRLPYRLVGACCIGSAFMGVVLVALQSITPVTGLPVLLAEILLGVLIYAGFVLVVPSTRNRIVMPGVNALR
jgi:O-antigen/teichoic acid export membrane protein